MLGLILLYWIGKYFYKLAEEYDKSKWVFAILGIVVYYVGSLLFGVIILFLIDAFSNEYSDDSISDFLLGVIAMPFGLLTCYFLYNYLKKTWQKEIPNTNKLIDEIGKPSDQIST
ncbi:hypothetical protein [Polaribacter sp. Hel_I_88]|uniref:hypothetical protein n=1 Tax=Polaribacter sp. Hel_I_88 TaxID=1250006 RepID=UPI00047E2FC6|nr:hypothetical protein [Polaribacter sp. Hel_I_88]